LTSGKERNCLNQKTNNELRIFPNFGEVLYFCLVRDIEGYYDEPQVKESL
jgi:hypothetical protein